MLYQVVAGFQLGAFTGAQQIQHLEVGAALASAPADGVLKELN